MELTKVVWMMIIVVAARCRANAGSARLLQYPSYIMAELKGSIGFEVSWVGNKTTTTLTVDQMINGAPTNVLDINGTYWASRNNWNQKMTAEITFDNSTNVFTMAVNLSNVAFEDEGRYILCVEGEGTAKTLQTTAELRIDTYARPVNLQITNVNKNARKYTEKSSAIFNCTGNVGRPLGQLRLVQSNDLQNVGYRTIETAGPEVITTKLLPNGTYTVSHIFNVSLNHLDNHTNVKCRLIHDTPDVTVTDSMALPIAANLSEVQMSVNPSEAVLGASLPLNTTFSCSISSLSIKEILRIQIARKKENGFDFDIVAEVKNTAPSAPGFIENAPSDITGRASVTGGIDTVTPTSSTLSLSMRTLDVVCSDKGQYKCILVYEDSTDNTIYTLENNQTLSIYALPMDISLTAQKGGQNVQGTGPGDRAATAIVNEVIEFTCLARIGSDNTTRLRWKRTSELGPTDSFIPYSQQTDYDDGTSSASQTDCRYSRTATLRYNVTLSDANRDNNLAFQCYISVVPPNGQGSYETENPPTFYINPVNPNAGGGGTGAASAGTGGSDIGGIIGGVIGGIVLIVLIVLLVYFLWYRRRGDGSTYRTKEETGEQNPNMVNEPAYAVPNKEKKRGHENKGLDDRHTNRHKDDDGYTNRRSYDHYEDLDDDHYDKSSNSRDRGRANYALDDDEYPRDGSPTINHMGMDPANGSYGTGV